MNKTTIDQKQKAVSWPAFTTVAPSHQEGKVILSNLLLHKKAAMPYSVLQQLLNNDENSAQILQKLTDMGLIDQEVESAALKGIRHWEKRKWSWSLPLYLASRNVGYQDTHDSTTEIRKKTLQKYIETDGEPPTPVVSGEGIVLPEPEMLPEDVKIGELMMNRSSKRLFIEGVTVQELSNVLWYGLKEVRSCRKERSNLVDLLKSYGVAFEIYLVVYDISGVEPGIYRYDITQHTLNIVCLGDFRNEMVDMLMGQTPPLTAALTLFITTDFRRYQWRYRHERALRNLYVESGRVMHKILMVSAAYQMGGITTPAIKDREVNRLFRLDDRFEQALYSVTMGRIET